jgi:hypothetical protein
MKLIAVGLLVVGLFYALYAGFIAVRSYLDVSSAVDRALEEQARNGAASVRAGIVKHAGEAGVPLDDRLVQVGEDERSLSVRLRWSSPVITYNGQHIIEIPLSLERGYAKP